jgi:hypothetical protein
MSLLRFALLVTVLSLAFGCASGSDHAVGTACVSDDEYSTTASGFTIDQVTVEVGAPSCDGRVCLINRFQGRVTCPYGALDSDVRRFVELRDEDPVAALEFLRTPNPQHGELPQVCLLPGRDGSQVDDFVIESVRPQLETRSPSDSVYCSCRCAGPPGAEDPAGGAAQYCECGEGFTCEHLLDDLGFGNAASGSYCVREGTMEIEMGATCVEGEGNCAGR